jgi:NitT/TauT family transport system ATP-binding protein
MPDQQSTLQVSAQAPALRLLGLTKRFGSLSGGYTAVKDITLDCRAGTFVSLVGPSGCGKSTILNMAAGLTTPSEGTIEVFGDALTGLNRRASYMFQQDALLPWKSVLENIMLGLRFRHREETAARQLAGDWLRRVGLDGFGESFPYQLSGGMRKRVAMAQTWIIDPDLVLMDEPFGALDVHTRLKMEGEILDLWTGSQKTIIFITHDLEEAIALSDEVIVLSAGPASRIVGRYPVDLERPRNLIDIKTDRRFGELYRTIWSDLREEVLKSYEQGQK